MSAIMSAVEVDVLRIDEDRRYQGYNAYDERRLLSVCKKVAKWDPSIPLCNLIAYMEENSWDRERVWVYVLSFAKYCGDFSSRVRVATRIVQPYLDWVESTNQEVRFEVERAKEYAAKGRLHHAGDAVVVAVKRHVKCYRPYELGSRDIVPNERERQIAIVTRMS
jgi:hypothetical protein